MTVIASIARNDMRRILARRSTAIVAATATSRYGRMIHVGQRTPGSRRMTVGTRICRRNMSDRFGRRLHRADPRMAGNACSTCAFEGTARMAVVAANAGMSTIQLKPGTEVVKRLLCFRRRREC